MAANALAKNYRLNAMVEAGREGAQTLTDALNRGMVAGTIGAPVDLANQALTPFGYGTEKPVMGSEWIGDKMQKAGMVSDKRNGFAEFIASLIDPASSTAAAVKAPVALGAVAKLSGKIPDIVKNKALISHRPMTIEGGASTLDNLLTSFGPDIYTKNALQYFGSGDLREKKVVDIIRSLRGKPDELVQIYRGVPENVEDIAHGDWITLLPEVAAEYGPKVLSATVPAKHITSWPDSLLEFGYYPK